jgi:hypothetical protein
MIKYSSIKEVIGRVQELPWNGSLFVDHAAWSTDPENTPIYLFDEREAMLGAMSHESLEPDLARMHGVEGFFDVVTFLKVVAASEGESHGSKVRSCISEINAQLRPDDS